MLIHPLVTIHYRLIYSPANNAPAAMAPNTGAFVIIGGTPPVYCAGVAAAVMFGPVPLPNPVPTNPVPVMVSINGVGVLGGGVVPATLVAEKMGLSVVLMPSV